MSQFKSVDTHGAGPPIQVPADELDAATVERCAQVAEQWLCRSCGCWFDPVKNCSCESPSWERQRNGVEIASAIRSLISHSANEIHSSDDSSKPTCELCGAGVVDPCQTKEQQAKCELPSSTFRYGQYDAKVVDPAVMQDCAPAGTVSEQHRKIAMAAINFDGFTAVAPPPKRHSHIIRALATAGHPIPIDGVQGFLTTDGLFATRTEAMRIAREAGQLLQPDAREKNTELFSEDVW